MSTVNTFRNLESGAAALKTDLLLEIFDGDKAAVDALLICAIETIACDVRTIDEAIAEHDGPGVIEAAHRIKGTTGSLRANRVLAIATEIEGIPKTQPWDVQSVLVEELHAAVKQLKGQIQAHSSSVLLANRAS